MAIVSIAVTITPSAHAMNSIRSAYLDNYRDIVHQVAVVDEEDRRTESKYAAENRMTLQQVKKTFAPTGKIFCNGQPAGSAQVTYKNNVISTAGHVFFDPESCRQTNRPESCEFRTEVNGRAFVSGFKNVVKNGIQSACPNPEAKNDWAVLRLETPLPSQVEPYGISDQIMREGEAVVMAAGRSDDFYIFNTRTGQRDYPKHLGNCGIQNVYGGSRPFQFGSNCDTGGGASGGSILRMENGRPLLVGIMTRNDETAEQRTASTAGNRPAVNRGQYKSLSWGTYGVPITGDLLTAIRRAGDSDDI